jgi:hypothetical protein
MAIIVTIYFGRWEPHLGDMSFTIQIQFLSPIQTVSAAGDEPKKNLRHSKFLI